jgi:prevent-host-death family protein
MKDITSSEFKKNAPQVIARVARTKKSVIVTKRGRPLVEVIPFRGSEEAPAPGRLSETLVFEKDIVSPIGGFP